MSRSLFSRQDNYRFKIIDRAKSRINPTRSSGSRQKRRPRPVAKRMISDRKTITRDVRLRRTKTFGRRHRLSGHESFLSYPDGIDAISFLMKLSWNFCCYYCYGFSRNKFVNTRPSVQLRAPRAPDEIHNHEGWEGTALKDAVVNVVSQNDDCTNSSDSSPSLSLKLDSRR